MGDEQMIRVRQRPDGSTVQVLADGSTRTIVSTADWQRVNAMTEDEVDAIALADPDNPPMTATELAWLRRAPNPRRM